MVARNTAQFGGVQGDGWQLKIGECEQGYAWVALDEIGLLRTLLARFSANESNELAALTTYIQSS